MWAHEWFELAEAPDIVTFSKKMLTGGLYHKPDLRPKQAWRIFNTWVGDPSKVSTTISELILNSYIMRQLIRQLTMQLVLLEAVLNTMEADQLLHNTQQAGEVLMAGLLDLQVTSPDLA